MRGGGHRETECWGLGVQRGLEESMSAPPASPGLEGVGNPRHQRRGGHSGPPGSLRSVTPRPASQAEGVLGAPGTLGEEGAIPRGSRAGLTPQPHN